MFLGGVTPLTRRFQRDVWSAIIKNRVCQFSSQARSFRLIVHWGRFLSDLRPGPSSLIEDTEAEVPTFEQSAPGM